MEPPFSEVGPGLEGTQGLETCKRKVKSRHSPLRWVGEAPANPIWTAGQLLTHTLIPQTGGRNWGASQDSGERP